MQGMSNLEPRVAKLEAGLQSLADSVERLANSMEAQNSTILKKLDNQGKPNYPLLVSLLALILAFATAMGGAFVAPLHGEIRHIREASAEEEKRMAKEVDKLDERLQREYNLLNKTVEAKFEAVNQASLDRFNVNQRDILRINKWQDLILEERLRIPQGHNNGNNGTH